MENAIRLCFYNVPYTVPYTSPKRPLHVPYVPYKCPTFSNISFEGDAVVPPGQPCHRQVHGECRSHHLPAQVSGASRACCPRRSSRRRSMQAKQVHACFTFRVIVLGAAEDSSASSSHPSPSRAKKTSPPLSPRWTPAPPNNAKLAAS